MAMAQDSRADGTLIFIGGSLMIATTLAPRLKDYAVFLLVHVVACIVALCLGTDSTLVPGRVTNFLIMATISVAVAYKSERKRRENVLLAWQLRQSNAAASLAGAHGCAAHWVPWAMVVFLTLTRHGGAQGEKWTPHAPRQNIRRRHAAVSRPPSGTYATRFVGHLSYL